MLVSGFVLLVAGLVLFVKAEATPHDDLIEMYNDAVLQWNTSFRDSFAKATFNASMSDSASSFMAANTQVDKLNDNNPSLSGYVPLKFVIPISTFASQKPWSSNTTISSLSIINGRFKISELLQLLRVTVSPLLLPPSFPSIHLHLSGCRFSSPDLARHLMPTPWVAYEDPAHRHALSKGGPGASKPHSAQFPQPSLSTA